MSELVVIIDPADPDTFHTSATCVELYPLLERAEERLGHPVDHVDELVEQAFHDGLLLLDGVAAGLRWCRDCRRNHEAVTLASHAVAA
jgi:hypothetical protein